MTGNIAHHTVIVANSVINVNTVFAQFAQFFTIVQFGILDHLMTEFATMEQEVSTALLLWDFSGDNYSFHSSSLKIKLYYNLIFIVNRFLKRYSYSEYNQRP
jgi:hypothetical protein